MKTLKSILFYCYVNMILLTAVLLALSHFIFAVPWKFEIIPAFVWLVATIAISYPIKCLRFVRIIWWPSVKHQFIMKLAGANPLLAYPGTIFLELSCRDIFIAGGIRPVADGLMKHLEKTRDGLLDMSSQLAATFAEAPSASDEDFAKLMEQAKAPLEKISEAIPPEHRQKCCGGHCHGEHCETPA